jgi:uncharacterized protein YqgV (UPF0045/DUF77 family)
MVTDSIVATHVTTAALSVGFINWLKANNSPLTAWITKEKPRMLRYVALATAAIGTIGIHYTWNPAERVLSFDIPTAAATLTALLAYAKSFIWQELTYQVTKRPNVAELVKSVVESIRNSQPAPTAQGAVKQ